MLNYSFLAPTLRRYERGWIVADVLAGLTLLAIAVPEQMATARLAGMPEVAGLYAFVAGSMFIALLGASRYVSVGADSTIAPVLAAGAAVVAANGTAYQHAVSFLALLVGVLVIAVGVLRLGWISEFLSAPVITGILGGIAVEIIVRQIPTILGLPGGGTTTIDRLHAITTELAQTNWPSVAIGASVFAVTVGARHLDRRLPGALLGLIAATAATAALDLESHGVVVLGPIAGGLPTLTAPRVSWNDVGPLVGPALTVAFLCVAQTAATVRSASATDADPEHDLNRDLLAIGAASLLAGSAGSFAVNSSPPRSEVVHDSGGKTQITSVVAAAGVLAVALFATGLLHDLPVAALGAILLFVATHLLRLNELRDILRFDPVEFALATVTLLVVAFVGIEQGVAAAMILSLADRTWRAARPPDAVLGREPGTDHWIPDDIGRATEHVPGVLVYLIYAPLWYGDASHLRTRISELINDAHDPVHALVIDANGISDIDYTGTRTLAQLADTLQRSGITLAIARSSHAVHHDLKHAGLLRTIGTERLFDSVDEAVAAMTQNPSSNAPPPK